MFIREYIYYNALSQLHANLSTNVVDLCYYAVSLGSKKLFCALERNSLLLSFS